MNNKEFITEMSARTGLGVKDVAANVTAFVSLMTEELLDENVISISGFGSFEVKKKLERVVVNPATKQKMLTPPKMTVNFKPFSTLKEMVSGK